MRENDKLQRKLPDSLKEKTQYVLTFGVIAAMLVIAQFPAFVIAFFGIFAYFLWKTFIQSSPNSNREVFEFYLNANEILRNEDRRWFGFEIQEVIHNGENILQRMNGAPPLVYFTLGALYNKVGNHKAAVNHLGYVLENSASDESNYLYATPELKEYVKTLRKIEREPSEAPQTSAAIRSLERTRRNRGKAILEESRRASEIFEQKQFAEKQNTENGQEKVLKGLFDNDLVQVVEPVVGQPEGSPQNSNGFSVSREVPETNVEHSEEAKAKTSSKNGRTEKLVNRKPITELLHEIYDK